MRAAILGLVVLASTTTPGAAADIGAGRTARTAVVVETSTLPACDDPSVLSKVVERQHWAEANTWHDGKRIETLTDIRQRYNTTRFASMIEHRHCEGEATLGAGRSDRVFWVISAETGFAGIGYGVEVCLPSQDYWYVWDAACRVLR
ncbi:hypothetical protein [Chthonobacter rhizosphaerae]|uniref:hypothetical protein n=1 Tax=Chthonobacter rhizosphaerae TaxID=2735553 RepID=UPI001FE36500|nr:hypothetical protein [Chthonobacter rhizosphaerae]